MFTLAAGESLCGVAGSASAVTYTVTGDEKTTVDTYKVLAQGQLPNAIAALYTSPGSTAALVQQIFLNNTTAGAVAVTLAVNGVSAVNRIMTLTVPANGSASYGHDGWKVYDALGVATVTASPISATGDATGTQSGTNLPLTLATVNANTGSWGTASSVPQFTVNAKGLMTAAGNVSIAIAESAVTNLVSDLAGKQATGNYITALTSDVTAAGPGSVAATLATVNANVGSFGSATQVMTQTVNAKGLTTAAANVTIQIPESQVTNLTTDLAGKQPLHAKLTGISAMSATSGVVTHVGSDAYLHRVISAASSKVLITDGNFVANSPTIDVVPANFTGIPESGVTNLVTDLAGKVPTTRNVNTTAPLTGGGALSSDLTVAISPATVSAAGSLSAVDKSKLDNMWIDVSANTTALYLTTNTAAQNITAINAILAAAPNGSTIYIPPGRYDNNAAWTMPNKMFSFVGRGSNRAGSPATAFTELRWTSNVGGTLITLPGSGNGWYTTFRNLTFTTSVDQTVGSVIDANGNVGVNIRECAFQSNGGFFLNVLNYGGGAGSNSGNSTVVDGCNIQGFKGHGIIVNSAGSSLVVSGSVVQGLWGTATQAALSCVNGKWVGALQIIGCDMLGAVNNILSDPTAASSEVCASIHIDNTYFDNALGSCFKVTGTGATVRLKADTCTFTTSNGGTGFSAVELAGSFVYGAGGQDISFVNCNMYNTFATTGTTNGVLISNAADVSFTNVKVAGWTNGYNVTPMASNKTNLQIIGGTVGPSGGYGGNSVGLLIGAGAYKGLQVRGCNAINNTTNLTLGAVTVLAGEGSLFSITENAGINPRGAVTTPTYPATTVVVTNTTGFRCQVMHKLAATTTTALTLNGVATVVPNVIQTISYTLEPGGTIAIAFTGTAGTWTWVGQ